MIAGFRGVSLLGTPVPTKNVRDSLSDSEPLHTVSDSQKLLNGKSIEVGRNIV
jgi:hypothetical protein